jgi:hypothetical protein
MIIKHGNPVINKMPGDRYPYGRTPDKQISKIKAQQKTG